MPVKISNNPQIVVLSEGEAQLFWSKLPKAKKSGMYAQVATGKLRIIQINHSDLKWVCLAASGDEIRYFMNGMHVEKQGRVWLHVATDGRRMHIFTSKKKLLPEGDYCVIKRLKNKVFLREFDVHFPDWRRVVPKYEKPKRFSAAGNGGNPNMRDVARILPTLGYKTKGQVALNPFHVRDILNCDDLQWKVIYQIDKVETTAGDLTVEEMKDGTGKRFKAVVNRSIVFANHDKSKRAIIMPLQT